MFSKTIKDEEWLQMKKRISCVLLCFALVISGLAFPYKNISAQATKEMANLVLFISFADTEKCQKCVWADKESGKIFCSRYKCTEGKHYV